MLDRFFDANDLDSIDSNAKDHSMTIPYFERSPTAPTNENLAFFTLFCSGSIRKLYEDDKSAFSKFVPRNTAFSRLQLVNTEPERSALSKNARIIEQALNCVFFNGSRMNDT